MIREECFNGRRRTVRCAFRACGAMHLKLGFVRDCSGGSGTHTVPMSVSVQRGTRSIVFQCGKEGIGLEPVHILRPAA